MYIYYARRADKSSGGADGAVTSDDGIEELNRTVEKGRVCPRVALAKLSLLQERHVRSKIDVTEVFDNFINYLCSYIFYNRNRARERDIIYMHYISSVDYEDNFFLVIF